MSCGGWIGRRESKALARTTALFTELPRKSGSAKFGPVPWQNKATMPHYCYLRTDLRCPHCDAVYVNRVPFQWGYSPGRYPREEYIYRLGDPIRWRYCEDSGLHSWAAFRGEGEPEGMNIGDPAFRDLIFRDSFVETEGWRCQNCGHHLGGAAIEIRDNYIRRAWIYEPGEFGEGEIDHYLIRKEGLVPIPEWLDHPMGSVHECPKWRLVVPYLSNGRRRITCPLL